MSTDVGGGLELFGVEADRYNNVDSEKNNYNCMAAADSAVVLFELDVQWELA